MHKDTIYNNHWKGFQSGELDATRGAWQLRVPHVTYLVSNLNHDLRVHINDSGMGYSSLRTRFPRILFADDIVFISEDPGLQVKISAQIMLRHWLYYGVL